MKCTGKENCQCDIHVELRAFIQKGEDLLKQYIKMKNIKERIDEL